MKAPVRCLDSRRAASGMTLVVVLVVSLVAMLLVSGFFTELLPVYQRSSNSRVRTALRGATEAAIDWAANTLSQGGSSAAVIDAPNPGESTTTTVPTSALGNAGMPIITKITVNNIPAPSYSYLYNSWLASQAHNYWRTVTATSTSPSGLVDCVRTVLAPTVTQSSTGPSTWNLGALTVGQYFSGSGQASIYAYDSVINPHPNTKSPPVTYTGDNSSTGSLWKGPLSGADVSIIGYAAPGQKTPAPSSLSGQVVVGGNLTYSSSTTLTKAGQSAVCGTTAVLPSTTVQLPPPAQAPVAAVALNPISLSGRQTLTLNSGDYYINSNGTAINLSGQSAIILGILNNVPVRIWIEGTNPSINFSGQGVQNSSGIPSNFQLFYGGSGSITFSGQSDLYGVIYAPSAPLKMSGQSNIWGGVAAASLDMSGQGDLIFDRQLLSKTLSITSAGASSNTWDGTYQAVSWQECKSYVPGLGPQF